MDAGWIYELTKRLVYGEKAYHSAAEENGAKSRRGIIRDTARRFRKDIDAIETHTEHKVSLMSVCDKIISETARIKEPSWTLIYYYIELVARLLGYANLSGHKVFTAFYWQTSSQRSYTPRNAQVDPLAQYGINKNVILTRLGIIELLKKEGYDSYQIALIMNTSEKEVIKLRKAAALNVDEAFLAKLASSRVSLRQG